MKYFFLSILCITMFSSSVFAQYEFTIEKSITCSPVKNQQRTGTCWSFATSSFLESELIRAGAQDADISEMYIVRNIYLDKALNYLLRQGKANFSQGSLSHDVIRAIKMAGAIPESVYSGKLRAVDSFDHSEMEEVLKSALDVLLKQKKSSGLWKTLMNNIMDTYMGVIPESFMVNGKNMTPIQYATHLNLDMGEFKSITSFTHHPFYDSFVLEIPDNYSNGSFYNIPMEEMKKIVDQSLDQGYSVAWDGDVSEKGFSARDGIAVLAEDEARADLFTKPGKEVNVTQEARQSNFENFTTTDDHLMHLVGSSKDQYGNRYYIIKNSWGEISDYDGYLYMSEPYFLMKTIAVMVNQNAIPSQISTKLAP